MVKYFMKIEFRNYQVTYTIHHTIFILKITTEKSNRYLITIPNLNHLCLRTSSKRD